MANGTFLDEEDEQNTELNGTAAETLDTARNAAKTAKEEVTENPVPAPEQPEAPVTESTEPPAAPAPAEETPAPETPAEPEPVQTVDNRWVSPDREDRQKRQQSRLELARRLEKMSEFISKETGDDPDFKETHDEAVKVNELLKYSPQRFADLSDEDAAFVANDIQTKYDHANQRRGHLAVAWDAFKKGYWSTGNMIYQGGTMLKPGGLTQDDADNIRGSMQTNEDMEILNPQKIGGVENIHSIGDAIDWLIEVVGENATRGVVATAAAAAGAYAAPVLATALGGGAAAAGVAGTLGSILTGTLGTMAMNTGEAVQDQMNDPRNNDDIRNSRQWALAQGFGYSVIDGAFGVSAWGAKLWTNMLRKAGVKELAQTGAVAAARQIEKNTVLGNVLKDIALHGVLGEGAQEVAQSQVVGRGIRWAQYGSPFKMKEDGSTETLGEAGMEALNEFAGGAAAGLTFGLLGGAGAHVDANKRFKTLDGIEDVLNNDPNYQKLDTYGKILVKQHLINDSFLETSGYLGYKIEDGKLVNEINERTQMNKEIDEEIDRMGDEKNANETEKLIGQSARAYLDIFKSQYSLADIDTVVGSPEGQKYQSNVDVAGMKASAQPYTDKEGNRAILMECPNTHITIAQLCDKDGKPTGRYVVNNDPERKSPVFGTKTETVKEVQKDENGKDVEVDVEKRTSEFDCASAEEALEKARKLDVYNQWRADRLKMKMDVARKVFDNIFAGRGVNLVFVDKPSRNAHINGISTGAYTAETNTVELAIDSIDNLGSLYTTLIHERSHEDIVEFLLKSGKFYKKVGDRTTIDWDAFNLAREQLFAKVKGAEEMSAMFRNQGAKADENGRYKDSEIRNEWGKSAGTAGEEMIAESASVGELANRLRRGESGVFGSIIDAVRSAIGMRMAMDMRVDMSAVKKEDVAKEIDKIFKIGYIGVPASEGFERENATERTVNPTDEDYVLSTDQFKEKFGSPDVPSVNPGEKLNLGGSRDNAEKPKKTDSAKKVDAVPVAEGNLKPQMNSGDGAKMANGTDIRRADGTMFTKTDAGNGNYVWVGMSGEVVDDETASRGGYEVVGSEKSAPAPKAKKSAAPKKEKAAKPTEVKAEPIAATESVAEAAKTPVPAVAEPQPTNETDESPKAAEPVKAAPVTNAAPKEVKTEKSETKPAEPAKSEAKESAAEPAPAKTEEESPVKVEPGEKIKIPQNRTEQPVKVDAASETATVAQEKPKKGGKAKKADKPKGMPAKTKRDLLKQTGLSAKAIGPKAEAAWMNLDEIPNGTVVSVEGAKFTKVGKISEGKPESKWTNAEGKTVLQTKLAQIVAQYGDFKTESAPVTETKPTEAKDEDNQSDDTISVEPKEKNEKKQVKKEDSKAEPKKSEPTPKPDNEETKPVEPVKVDKEKETASVNTSVSEIDAAVDRVIDGNESLKFITSEQRAAVKKLFRTEGDIDTLVEAKGKRGILIVKAKGRTVDLLKPDGSPVTEKDVAEWQRSKTEPTENKAQAKNEEKPKGSRSYTSHHIRIAFRGVPEDLAEHVFKNFPKEAAELKSLSDRKLLKMSRAGNALATYELFVNRFFVRANNRGDGGLVRWLAKRGITDPQEAKRWALRVFDKIRKDDYNALRKMPTEEDIENSAENIQRLTEALAKEEAKLYAKDHPEESTEKDESTRLAIMDRIIRLTGQGVKVPSGYGYQNSIISPEASIYMTTHPKNLADVDSTYLADKVRSEVAEQQKKPAKIEYDEDPARIIYNAAEALWRPIEIARRKEEISASRAKEVQKAIDESKAAVAEMVNRAAEYEREDMLAAFAEDDLGVISRRRMARALAESSLLPREYKTPMPGETENDFWKRMCARCVPTNALGVDDMARAAVKGRAVEYAMRSPDLKALSRDFGDYAAADVETYIFKTLDEEWRKPKKERSGLWNGDAKGTQNLGSHILFIVSNYCKEKRRELSKISLQSYREDTGGNSAEIADSRDREKKLSAGSFGDLSNTSVFSDDEGDIGGSTASVDPFKITEAKEREGKGLFTSAREAMRFIIDFGIVEDSQKPILEALMAAWTKVSNDAYARFYEADHRKGARNVKDLLDKYHRTLQLGFPGGRFDQKSDEFEETYGDTLLDTAADLAGMKPLAYMAQLNRILDEIQYGLLGTTGDHGEAMVNKIKSRRSGKTGKEFDLTDWEKRIKREFMRGRFGEGEVKVGLSNLRFLGSFNFGQTSSILEDMEYNGDDMMAWAVKLAEEGETDHAIQKRLENKEAEGLNNPSGVYTAISLLRHAHDGYGWIDKRISGIRTEKDNTTKIDREVRKQSAINASWNRIISDVIDTYDMSPVFVVGEDKDSETTPEAVKDWLDAEGFEVSDDVAERISKRTIPAVKKWLEENKVDIPPVKRKTIILKQILKRLKERKELDENKASKAEKETAYKRQISNHGLVVSMIEEVGSDRSAIEKLLRDMFSKEYVRKVEGDKTEVYERGLEKRVKQILNDYDRREEYLSKHQTRASKKAEVAEAKAQEREERIAASENFVKTTGTNEAVAASLPYETKKSLVINELQKTGDRESAIQFGTNQLKLTRFEANMIIEQELLESKPMTDEDWEQHRENVGDVGLTDTQIEEENRKLKAEEANARPQKPITDGEREDAKKVQEIVDAMKRERPGEELSGNDLVTRMLDADRNEVWEKEVAKLTENGMMERSDAERLADITHRRGYSESAIARMLSAYKKVRAEEDRKDKTEAKTNAGTRHHTRFDLPPLNAGEHHYVVNVRNESGNDMPDLYINAISKKAAEKKALSYWNGIDGRVAKDYEYIAYELPSEDDIIADIRYHFRHSAEDKAAISGMKASQKVHGFLDAKYKGRPHRRDEEIDREAEELRQKIGTREWQAIVERGRTREALTEAEIRALTLEMGSRMADTLDKNLTADESEDNEKVLDELSDALVGSLSAAGAALRQAQRGFNIRTRDTDVYIRAQLRSALEKEAAKRFGEAGVSEHAAEIEKAIEEKSAIIAEQAKELQKLHDQIDTLNSRIEAKNDKADDKAIEEAYERGYGQAKKDEIERRDKALSAFSKKFGDRLDSSKSDIGLAALSKLASLHNISRRYAGNPSPELDNDTRNAFKALLAWTKKDENVAREALREDGQESLIPLFDMFIKETDRESKPADGLKETGKRNRDRILDDYVSPTAATVEESDAEAAKEAVEEIDRVEEENNDASPKKFDNHIVNSLVRKIDRAIREANATGDEEVRLMYIGEFARNWFKLYYYANPGKSRPERIEALRDRMESVFKENFSTKDAVDALLCRGDFPAITKKRSKLTLEQLEQAKALVREGKPREAAKMVDMDYKSDDEIIEELDRRLGNVLNQRLNVFESRINEEEDEGLKNEIHELIAAIREVRSGKPMDYLLGKYLKLAEGMKDYRRQKSLLDRIQSRIDMYARKIAENDFEPAPKRENPDCDEEIMIIQSKNRKLEKMRQMYKNVRKEWTLAKRPWLSRAAHGLIELLMESKAVAGAMDLSSVLRQGGQMTWAHPLIAAKNLKRTFAAFRDEKAAEAMFDEIWSRPNAKYYLKAGIDFTDWGEGGKNQSDQFMLNHYRKFTNMKLVKAGVTASERAFSMYLNMMRADMFDMLVRSSPLRDASKFTEEQLKAIGNFINIASQRGVVDRSKELGKALNAMNMVLWSPRNILSRFQFLWNTAKLLLPGVNPYGASSGDMMMRKMFAKETLRYITGVAGAIFFTKMMADLFRGDDEPPEDVVLDPRSSDFLKVKVGNTRLDFLSGLQQMFVFGTRAFSHQTVNLRGELKELSNPADYYALFARFARSKFSPMASIVWDTAIARETYDRQDVSWSLKDQLRDDKEMVGVSRYVVSNLFCPLSFRDLVEQAEYSGIGRAPATWILTMLGAGVQAFDPYTYKQMSQDFKYFKNLYANADSAEERSRLVEYHPMLNRAGAIEAQIKYVNRIKRDIKNAEKAGMRTDLLEDMLEREQKRAINLMAGFKKPMDVD